MKVVLFALALLAFSTAPHAQEKIILPQRDAPVALGDYIADVGAPRGQAPQLAQRVLYKNTMRKQLVAVEVGFAAFDTYNDFLAWTSASSTDPGNPKPDEQVVSATTPDDVTSFYTGVAYVSRARFADGTIWEADLGQVLNALQQYDSDLTMADIQE